MREVTGLLCGSTKTAWAGSMGENEIVAPTTFPGCLLSTVGFVTAVHTDL